MAACWARAPEEQEAAFELAYRENPDLADEIRARRRVLEDLGFENAPSEFPFPERLGDFRLLEVLGRGGMGVVYRAEQCSLKREVALKLIRPEQFYFPGARERFRREAEAIARLRHPGIVPIYASGEENGVPYFAMELVAGETLEGVLRRLAGRAPESLRASDLTPKEQRAPDDDWPRAAARAAAQVARALEHAHAHGIVHRDVKPSNVAVGGDLGVRLLDFGLTSSEGASRVTSPGSQPGTLLYQSPQQVRGETPEPRDDVYSLGVTLYEMLTLQVPFTGESAEEVRRQILTGSPSPIRARNRRVPVDLETVCLVAMEPDAARRYASAGALANDLENVLARRPIEARPPGAWVRFQRLAERNKAATAVVAATLIFLTAAPTALWLREQHHASVLAEAYAKTLDEYQTAEQALAFLEDVFRASTPSEARGEQLLVRDVVDRGAKRLEANPDMKASVVGRLLGTLGIVYRELGLYTRSLELTERAMEIAERLRGGRDNAVYAILESNLASAYAGLGDHPRSEALFRSSIARMEALDLPPLKQLRIARNNFSNLLSSRGEWKEAEALILASLETDSTADAETAALLANLASTLVARKQYAEATQVFDKALTIVESSVGRTSPQAAAILNNRARASKLSGDVPEARRAYEEALRIVHALHPEPTEEVAIAELNYAELLRTAGEFEEAEKRTRRGIEILATRLRPEHPTQLVARFNLAGFLWKERREDEAAALYEEHLPAARLHLTGPGHAPILSFAARNLGRVRKRQGNVVEAEALLREAAGHLARAGPAHAREIPPIVLELTELWEAENRLANEEDLLRTGLAAAQGLTGAERSVLWLERCLALCLLAKGDAAGAEAHAAEAVRFARERFAHDWTPAYCRAFRGSILTAAGRFDEAEPELLEGHAGLTGGAPDFVVDACVEWIVAHYRSRGDEDAARSWATKRLLREEGK